MSEQERVQRLIVLAREALASSNEDSVEDFVVRIESYLQELESWQKEASQNNPLKEDSGLSDEERGVLRDAISELDQVHRELMAGTEQTKDGVGAAMGDLHRRSSGLKKYIDTQPSRISITGKRKG